MIIIHYCPEGKAVSDFNLQSEINSLKPNTTYQYSTDNMVSAIREAVFEKRLHWQDVKFKFIDAFHGETFITIDSDGNIDRQPEGFYDREEKALFKIFRGHPAET